MAVKKKTKKKKSKKASAKKHGNCKFDEALIPIIKNLMLKGYIDLEIAELLGITEATFYNWKKAYPEVFESEGEWKRNANEELERTLHKLASGWICKETKVFLTKDGTIKTYEVWKQHPPNEKAIEFALTNRSKDRWKNTSKIEHHVGDTQNEFTLNYKPGDSKKKKPN